MPLLLLPVYRLNIRLALNDTNIATNIREEKEIKWGLKGLLYIYQIQNDYILENYFFILFNSHKAQEVLRGTFYMASLMAHSCVVNAQISIGNDSQMTVKATVPIQEGKNTNIL